MPIGEAILGSLLGSSFLVLFDKLASSGLNSVQREGIGARLDNWKKMLQIIFRLLNDAEDRQLIGDMEVKSWLEDVRELAYDLEDLLDEFAIKAVKQEQGKFLCRRLFNMKNTQC